MNEQAGDTQSGPISPRPNRRPPRPRRRGPRRPRDNRDQDPLPLEAATPSAEPPIGSTVPESSSAQSDQPSQPPQPVQVPQAAQPIQQVREQQNRPPASSQPRPQFPRQQHQSQRPPQPQRPTGSPIAQAVAQVEQIIKNLKDSLRELEEVLESLDDAQRQQIGDEKEIESLRRALSILQRDRQSGLREEREQRDQPRRFDRRVVPENRNRPEPPSQAPSADAPPEEPAE